MEPCLNLIGGIAEGLGISTGALMDLDERVSGNSARVQLNDILSLCDSVQIELSLRLVRAVYDFGSPKLVRGGQNTQATP